MEPFQSNRQGEAVSEQPELFRLGSTAWRQGIQAGFTGRRGGMSTAPYDSFNLAYHVEDEADAVLANRRLLCQQIGFDSQGWVCGEQVHSNHIACVTADDAGRGWSDRSSAFQETDGLITDVPGILLTSFYADCVPLYFTDTVRRVVGLAHAGWKGTVANIAGEMIRTMEQQYGSKVADIHTAIGPSIGMQQYEVDQRVMEHVDVWTAKLAGNGQLPTYAKLGAPGKTWLDLKQLNRELMIFAGIQPQHIEISRWCTYERHDLFFSYRADGGVTGRMASWAGIETE
ncbi:peptidoglycan editing factor PgeF [Paenibacillus campi]|uniref:peptidoglycan editing factor PgeF n=1 Tax=Paenibacillus campi TaxID=3106031 RepID=UPI002AFE40CB|nr:MULTISPECIES: peptidoglycan editing factor PgeF [unclassified Paenibacillus]